jgi:hypothetical protein
MTDRKRGCQKDRRGIIKNQVSIDERPFRQLTDQ